MWNKAEIIIDHTQAQRSSNPTGSNNGTEKELCRNRRQCESASKIKYLSVHYTLRNKQMIYHGSENDTCSGPPAKIRPTNLRICIQIAGPPRQQGLARPSLWRSIELCPHTVSAGSRGFGTLSLTASKLTSHPRLRDPEITRHGSTSNQARE